MKNEILCLRDGARNQSASTDFLIGESGESAPRRRAIDVSAISECCRCHQARHVVKRVTLD